MCGLLDITLRMDYKDLLFAQNWVEQMRVAHMESPNDTFHSGETHLAQICTEDERVTIGTAMYWAGTREGFWPWSTRSNEIITVLEDYGLVR